MTKPEFEALNRGSKSWRPESECPLEKGGTRNSQNIGEIPVRLVGSSTIVSSRGHRTSKGTLIHPEKREKYETRQPQQTRNEGQARTTGYSRSSQWR